MKSPYSIVATVGDFIRFRKHSDVYTGKVVAVIQSGRLLVNDLTSGSIINPLSVVEVL